MLLLLLFSLLLLVWLLQLLFLLLLLILCTAAGAVLAAEQRAQSRVLKTGFLPAHLTFPPMRIGLALAALLVAEAIFCS
jgi:hypothetical protein